MGLSTEAMKLGAVNEGSIPVDMGLLVKKACSTVRGAN